ncbi:hypothetical protein LGKMAHEF_02239 [Aeromonas salmonicida]
MTSIGFITPFFIVYIEARGEPVCLYSLAVLVTK